MTRFAHRAHAPRRAITAVALCLTLATLALGCGTRRGGGGRGGDGDGVAGMGGSGSGGSGGGGAYNPCLDNLQCLGGDQCVDGICVPPGSVGTTCQSPSECESGSCIGGRCRAVGGDEEPGCESDADCPSMEYCHRAKGAVDQPGECRANCSETTQCDEGQLCANGRCYTLDPCLGSAQCPPNEVCDSVELLCTAPSGQNVDRCELVSPVNGTAVVSRSFQVVGRLESAGITDVTSGHDQDPRVRARAGWGPAGSHPAGNGAWVWFVAGADTSWTDDARPGADQYVAEVVSPTSVGTYSVVFSFSLDGGQNWTYCDVDTGVPGELGSENGFQPENAGTVELIPNPCSPNPCTNPDPPRCDIDGITLLNFTGPGTCTLDGVQPVCTYLSNPVDCSLSGGSCSGGQCAGGVGRPNAAGQIIITEMMPKSQGGVDKGEWLELHNTTDKIYNLSGCVLRDKGSDHHVISGHLVVLPGGHVVLAKSGNSAENHGLPAVDYVFTDFDLGNGTDEVILDCDGVEVDRIDYNAGWVFEGIAIQLSPSAYNHIDNNSLANFCPASVPYGASGKKGTPGAMNPACAPPDTSVDTCRVLGSSPQSAVEGTSLLVRGQVLNAGLTDLSPGIDHHPNLLAQLGYGAAGVDPVTNPGAWQWLQATPTPGWNDGGGSSLHYDQYQATMTIPAAGDYVVAYRFSLDGGASWTLCDRDGGDPAFDLAMAVELTSVVNPCTVGDPCPPIAQCEGDGLTSTLAPSGTCTVDGVNPQCHYAFTNFDCSAIGGTCVGAGECTGTFATPAAGEVVITELMVNPSAGLDPSAAQWIEVYNPTTDPLLLLRCTLEGSQGSSLLLGGLLLDPGSYGVLARSSSAGANGGLTAGDVFGFPLAPSDTVALVCDGAVVDSVAYDLGVTFPQAQEVSLSLDPSALDASSNDSGTAWCLSRAPTPSGSHYGTPGAPNPACKLGVDACRLDWAGDLVDVEQGTPVSAAVLVEDLDITDLTAGTDPHPALRVEVGIGPDGSAPSDPEWVWAATSADTGWTAPASPHPDASADRYAGSVGAPAPGSHDVAARVSVDGGVSWEYCDQDGGTYEASQAGSLITIPATGINLLFSEYVEGTSNNNCALEIVNLGFSPVDTGLCRVDIFSNGDSQPTQSINLTSVALNPGAVRTLCHTSMVSTATCHQSNGSVTFTGDDAIRLVCDEKVMDVIGQIGFRPNGAWGTAPLRTMDQTLRRKCEVTIGDRTGGDAFDPAVEWEAAGLDVFSDLGSRTCP